ncbi:TadE/TadG family type IV pilus assembly protein [Paenibacillus sp. SGZ-1009]|uniref:TadE/TadG family type IV pilus assembly protein n=1 Tax=Paenibacillus campi TaxID=3106031 RepID=UPI002AFE47E4|nr:TadE/TadG family type IV pilus assembly protein [Paenibacillus sp. SGZ-1009]
MTKRSFWSSARGSFTIEASAVFPIILLTTLLMMLFCMYLYQNTMLKQAAAKTSERAAYSWDNSYKNPYTGAFAEGEHDGLYWRLTQDEMLSKLFGWAGTANEAKVFIPSGGGGSLPEKKLAAASTWVPRGMNGTVQYNNGMLVRSVETTLSRPLFVPPLERMLNRSLHSQIRAGAVIVEPVEYIRNVELMRYYAAKAKGGAGPALQLDKAGAILQWFGM